MSTRRHQSALLILQDRVANIYYTHGLFCSMHPVPVLCFTALVVLLCCYPLVYLTFPGSVPREHTTPVVDYLPPPSTSLIYVSTLGLQNNSSGGPRWYQGLPASYVLQVVVHSAVSPWETNLTAPDALRGPLGTVFGVVEMIRNFQHVTPEGSRTLDDFCTRVSEPMNKQVKDFLPNYNCLLVSPANIWKSDFQGFQVDEDLLKTVYGLGAKRGDPKPTPKDIMFGVSEKNSGLKKWYGRSKQTVVMYSITIAMKEFDSGYVQGLEERLHTSFPYFHHDDEAMRKGNMSHVHFDGHLGIVEFIPLFVTYVILFLYIYFSVCKIEMVKSKFGMAFSAVVTVLASLCMSVGLCTWFGLSFTGQVYLKDIFPYLVVIVGLENILVLTKSVVATPVHLDVKVRVAQGLSKEGWSITKNLLTELCILTLSFFTFVHAIQEFCLFAVVGLLSDFFLQLVFFATVLSIDIRRMETSELHRQMLQQGIEPVGDKLTHMYPLFPSPLIAVNQNKFKHSRLLPKTASEETVVTPGVVYPTDVVAPEYKGAAMRKVPKRLRLVYFWARCRIFQRAFMVCFSVWIAYIVYKSGIVGFLTLENAAVSGNLHTVPTNLVMATLPDEISGVLEQEAGKVLKVDAPTESGLTLGLSHDAHLCLKHHETEPWKSLQRLHWPTLFGYYNISLQGRYVSLLPSIKLSIPVSPDEARALRLPSDSNIVTKSRWYLREEEPVPHHEDDGETPTSDETEAHYPTSTSERALAVVLAIPTVIFIVYLMVLLYHCICTRNYAEWRSSWSADGSQITGDIYTQLVFEAMPVLLDGHRQEVECLSTDGHFVVSSCLAGEIRVWDSFSGECLTVIDRKRKMIHRQRFRNFRETEAETFEDLSSDYESGSPPSRSEGTTRHTRTGSGAYRAPSTAEAPDRHCDLGPDLTATISTDFSSRRGKDQGRGIFDFSNFQIYYDEHKELLAECTSKEDSTVPDPVPIRMPVTDAVSEWIQIQDDHRVTHSAIWCLDCRDSIIAVGCSDGRLEFWDGMRGTLKCIYEDDTAVGVTGIRMEGNKVVAVRLNGSVDFLDFGTSSAVAANCQSKAVHAYRRSHVRQGSESSFGDECLLSWEGEELYCVWRYTAKAHQQPITVFEVEGGKVVTGSSDHTLKIFRLEDTVLLSTLHGHYGPITALFIDKLSPMTAASGSQDGALCVWDLVTGTCVCRLKGHDGAVTALCYTANYVLSTGTDDKLLVWERFQGHLLNTINLHHSYCSGIVMLTDNLILTGRQGSLVVWDIKAAEPVRIVRLGHSDQSVLVRQIRHVGHAIVCDYGNQLRVVRFPTIVDKAD